MAIKPDGGLWTVREQIIEDPACGLTFQFEVTPDGKTRFRVFGKALPYGNREIIFDKDGVEAAGGTVASGLCRPAWLDSVDL